MLQTTTTQVNNNHNDADAAGQGRAAQETLEGFAAVADDDDDRGDEVRTPPPNEDEAPSDDEEQALTAATATTTTTTTTTNAAQPFAGDAEEERRVNFERKRPEDMALVTAKPERRRSDAWRFGSIRGAAQRAGKNVEVRASNYRKWTDWVNAVEGVDTDDVRARDGAQGVEQGGGAGRETGRANSPAAVMNGSASPRTRILLCPSEQSHQGWRAARHSEARQEDAPSGKK